MSCIGREYQNVYQSLFRTKLRVCVIWVLIEGRESEMPATNDL